MIRQFCLNSVCLAKLTIRTSKRKQAAMGPHLALDGGLPRQVFDKVFPHPAGHYEEKTLKGKYSFSIRSGGWYSFGLFVQGGR